jgi:hypothetical protein
MEIQVTADAKALRRESCRPHLERASLFLDDVNAHQNVLSYY